MAAGRLIRGVRALGEALGVSHQTAHEYVRDERWTFGPGPWPATLVPRMQAWREAALARPAASAGGGEGEASPGTLTAAKILKTRASAQKDLLDIRIKSGKFHDAEECRRRRLLCIHQCKQDLLAIPDALPAEREVQDQVRRAIESVLERFGREYGQ